MYAIIEKPDNAAYECHRCGPGSYPGQADGACRVYQRVNLSAAQRAPSLYLCSLGPVKVCRPEIEAVHSGPDVEGKRAEINSDTLIH